MVRRVIVRHTDRSAGLEAGALGIINTETPLGVVRFLPVDPPIIPRWASSDMFLLFTHFLRDRRKLTSFWTLCNHRRQEKELPMFVSHPKEDLPSKIYGHRPFAFESEGEAAFWCRLKGLSLNEFIIGVNMPCRMLQ